MKPFTILSVDFDYFFALPPRNDRSYWLYDWGQGEADFLINAIWPVRAASFLTAGVPLPQTTGEETTFWGRFQIDGATELYVGESHASIVSILPEDGFVVVHSYDAHHDMGYDDSARVLMAEGEIKCDYWGAYVQQRGGAVHVHYPPWRKERPEDSTYSTIKPVTTDIGGADASGPFDAIFVCRSGAWVPSWCEDAFWRFIDAAPGYLISFGDVPRRDFSMEEAEAMAASLRSSRAGRM